MADKKENNFFTDYDLPFTFNSPQEEEEEVTGLIGDYKELEQTNRLPKVSPSADGEVDSKTLYISMGDEDRDEAYNEKLRKKRRRADLRAARKAAAKQEQEDDEEDAADNSRRAGCLTGILYFCLIVGISALLAAFIWFSANDVLALSKPEREITVTIEDTSDFNSVVEQLKDGKIIDYGWLFKLYANITGSKSKIKEGTFTIRSDYDYHAIISALSTTKRNSDTVMVTIPEGWTLMQIFERLAEKGVCTVAELLEAEANGVFDYSFIQNYEGTKYRLEGYLFPDTYEFYLNDNPHSVLLKMIRNFNNKFTADWREVAESRNLTIHQVMTIASMVERETNINSERELVSSVIQNRMKSNNFPYLQIDATVVYAFLPEYKERLSNADLELDDPYNTYVYKDLPPGPICSPGTASIRAALAPDDTSYYYYVLQKDGAHEFCKTKAEFEDAVRRAQG